MSKYQPKHARSRGGASMYARQYRWRVVRAGATVVGLALVSTFLLGFAAGGLELSDEHAADAGPIEGAVIAAVRTVRAAVTGEPAVPPLPAIDPAAREAMVYVGADGERITTGRIAEYLERFGSPMAPYAEDFVAAGVRYDVDPRLIVAISALESQFGVHDGAGHNAWGWGGGRIGWSDWPTAIDRFTYELGARYDTDDVDEGFASTYCPPNSGRWLASVRAHFAAI